MTAVTLKEFVERIKGDEAAVEKLRKVTQEQHLAPEAVAALAAEYGYEIASEPVADVEELSDEDLEHVVGGSDSTKLGNTLCRMVSGIFGWDEEYCD